MKRIPDPEFIGQLHSDEPVSDKTQPTTQTTTQTPVQPDMEPTGNQTVTEGRPNVDLDGKFDPSRDEPYFRLNRFIIMVK